MKTDTKPTENTAENGNKSKPLLADGISRKDYLINLRKEFLDYDVAKKVQNELKEIYLNEYVPKHTKEQYYDLLLEEEIKVEERHPQETNYSYSIYSSFSVASQHVFGHTKEHCLDLIFEGLQRKKERIEGYKKLPNLEVLVNSECCNSGFLLKSRVTFSVTEYTGDKKEDDWGNKIVSKK